MLGLIIGLGVIIIALLILYFLGRLLLWINPDTQEFESDNKVHIITKTMGSGLMLLVIIGGVIVILWVIQALGFMILERIN